MKAYQFFMLAMMTWISSSCTKVIDIKLKDAEPIIVIEGSVVNDRDRQLVKISKSIAFSDRNLFPAVTGASVYIMDNDSVKTILLEQNPGIYVTTDLLGMPNQTYTLNVESEGKVYTAVSTMPEPVPFDSVNVVVNTVFTKKYNSVEVYYQDAPGIKNYYRFKMKINGELSKAIFVYQDDFNDGKSVKREVRDFDKDILAGDDVEITMQSIDENTYKYWYGLAQNTNSGQASAAPANPASNISNGALGYFSAHTLQTKKFTIR